jgi:hypothetical protein
MAEFRSTDTAALTTLFIGTLDRRQAEPDIGIIGPRDRAHRRPNRNPEKEIGNVEHRRHRRLERSRGGAPRARAARYGVIDNDGRIPQH